MGELALLDAVMQNRGVLLRQLLRLETLLGATARLQRHRQLDLLLGGE
jgi:hypothetical protein